MRAAGYGANKCREPLRCVRQFVSDKCENARCFAFGSVEQLPSLCRVGKQQPDVETPTLLKFRRFYSIDRTQ